MEMETLIAFSIQTEFHKRKMDTVHRFQGKKTKQNRKIKHLHTACAVVESGRHGRLF